LKYSLILIGENVVKKPVFSKEILEVALKNYRRLSFIFGWLIIQGVLVSCSTTKDLAMAPLAQMPDQVRSAPVIVQKSYQFVIANPDLMKQIPCYCGCGAIGHTSNYACYVGENGIIDNHALGCSICVDITQDVMRLTGQGKDPLEIKNYIDSVYSKFGTSNIP
jgi:hypothetical protein